MRQRRLVAHKNPGQASLLCVTWDPCPFLSLQTPNGCLAQQGAGREWRWPLVVPRQGAAPLWPVMIQPSLAHAAFLDTVQETSGSTPWPYLAGPIWRARLWGATGYSEFLEQRRDLDEGLHRSASNIEVLSWGRQRVGVTRMKDGLLRGKRGVFV